MKDFIPFLLHRKSVRPILLLGPEPVLQETASCGQISHLAVKINQLEHEELSPTLECYQYFFPDFLLTTPNCDKTHFGTDLGNASENMSKTCKLFLGLSPQSTCTAAKQ